MRKFPAENPSARRTTAAGYSTNSANTRGFGNRPMLLLRWKTFPPAANSALTLATIGWLSRPQNYFHIVSDPWPVALGNRKHSWAAG